MVIPSLLVALHTGAAWISPNVRAWTSTDLYLKIQSVWRAAFGEHRD